MYQAVCNRPYVSGRMYQAVCIRPYVSGRMYQAACIRPYVSGRMYQEIQKENFVALATNAIIKSTAEIPLSTAKFGIKLF